MIKWKILAGILCIVLLLIDIFFVHDKHAELWFQHIKGHSILLGLFGSVLLMFGAKWFAKHFLYREPDHYD